LAGDVEGAFDQIEVVDAWGAEIAVGAGGAVGWAVDAQLVIDVVLVAGAGKCSQDCC
jgi:hypothetical protein